MEQVNPGAAGEKVSPSGSAGVGRLRRWGTAVRAAASASSASRRRPLMAAAVSIRPSPTSTSAVSHRNTVPPVFCSRCAASSAVSARFRAASGTGPVTVTACTPSLTVSAAGCPVRILACMVMGICLCSPFSYNFRASLNSSLGSGAFSGRVPNMAGPFRRR